jgi:hypothetical protein
MSSAPNVGSSPSGAIGASVLVTPLAAAISGGNDGWAGCISGSLTINQLDVERL